MRRNAPLERRQPIRRQGAKGRAAAAEVDQVRAAVLARADGRCERCAWEETRAVRLVLHHVVPRGRGGPHTKENLVALCRWCHDAVHGYRCPDWPRWLQSLGPKGGRP